ncbi:hypothetical protein HDU86_003324 [Geranomyces michiganensis]|nr:hypothetical protein HDU86_003324 [Geranomyces michiganensis]
MAMPTTLPVVTREIAQADLSSAVVYAGCISLVIVLVVKSFCDRCLDPGVLADREHGDARQRRAKLEQYEPHMQHQQLAASRRRSRHITTTDESFVRATGRESQVFEGTRASKAP